MDRESPPAPGGVLFVGSSSIRMWDTLARDFPGVPVVRRGFGGSAMADVVLIRGSHRHPLQTAPDRRLYSPATTTSTTARRRSRCCPTIGPSWGRSARSSPRQGWRSSRSNPASPAGGWRIRCARPTNSCERTRHRTASSTTSISSRRCWAKTACPAKDLLLEDGLHLTAEGYAPLRRRWSRSRTSGSRSADAADDAPPGEDRCIMSQTEAEIAVAQGASALGWWRRCPAVPA